MRTDVRLYPSPNYDFWDIAFTAEGDFDTTEGLDTAIVVSVLEEIRATEDEVVQPENRRGWCGALDNDFEQGSKLWLWEGSRLTQSVLTGVQSDTLTGLQWLLDDGLADELTVVASFVPSGLRLDIDIESDGNNIDNTLYYLWGLTNITGELT